ncbi:50S ribosomal protein L22 [Candidatus Micrarchaeota archaeon]|nr:50S ribosomal protein L22 [Candidatus Micrarchaeota archaeon]
MGLYDFSYQVKDEKQVARAQAYDLDASYKDLANIFKAIKGKTIAQGKKILEECISFKKAIPYVKFHKNLGHRSELGGRKGRYPKKEAKIVLVLLKSAEANANYKGLDPKTLVIRQGASYKQNSMRRYRHHFGSSITLGYGKQSIWASYETCRAELVLAKGSGKQLERALVKESKKLAGNQKRAKATPGKVATATTKPKADEKKVEKAKALIHEHNHETGSAHEHPHSHEGHSHEGEGQAKEHANEHGEKRDHSHSEGHEHGSGKEHSHEGHEHARK